MLLAAFHSSSEKSTSKIHQHLQVYLIMSLLELADKWGVYVFFYSARVYEAWKFLANSFVFLDCRNIKWQFKKQHIRFAFCRFLYCVVNLFCLLAYIFWPESEAVVNVGQRFGKNEALVINIKHVKRSSGEWRTWGGGLGQENILSFLSSFSVPERCWIDGFCVIE